MIPDPWRKRKQCSPTRRSFQLEQPQAAPNGCSRVTNHETRFLCFPTHDFPAFPAPPGQGSARRSHRQHGRLGFYETRITQHGFSQSLRQLQGEQPQARPTGFHETRITKHGLYASLPTIFHDFPAFPTISRPPHPPVKGPRAARSPLSCTLWSGMGRLWCGMGALWSPSPCPRAVRCEIPAMWTKSRFPQENARSAAFAAAPFALGAQPAAVDPNGHTAPGSAAKSPLFRVDSCPFVVNESMPRKGNVLYCIDRLFDKRAPAGSRGFRGECRAGWSGRASSSERKSHVPR